MMKAGPHLRPGAVGFIGILAGFMFFILPGGARSGLIQPGDLEYRGAFRLPDVAGDFGWGWGGHALAYYPAGDPNGPADGYPGSLFGTGHDWYQRVSEVSIPAPVVSPGKNLNDLNTAVTLQAFSDIKAGLFPSFEIPYAGLEYLPLQGAQTSGKLYFSWHQHLQISPEEPTHGWCELDLSTPPSAGPWYIGSYDTYSTTDYLFSIPAGWAAAHVGGRCLATGRFRDGGQGGQGPCIFAVAPWQQGNPPPPQAQLSAVPLLLYSTSYWDDPHGGAYTMDRYHHSDMWPGGAWLTAGNNSAVVFAGTKGRGDCWYGCADGTSSPPWPPDCERGWWSSSFAGEIIFYDPADLAAVAAGTMEPYEPQPYAVVSIDDVLYHVNSSQMYDHVKAAAFDREHGFLYLIEPLADGDKPLVHVWKVRGDGGAPTPPPVETPTPAPPTPTPQYLVLHSGDYDGDGRADIAVFRPETSRWAVRGITKIHFGIGSDIPAPGDYDGDRTTDIAVFRPGRGLWAVRELTRVFFGADDRPVSADYDGDGKTDIGIFRPGSGLWAVRGVLRSYFGVEGDLPVPADYDGDGTDDIGLFRPAVALWALKDISRIYFGIPGDLPVEGDYVGNGTASPAVFRARTGMWAVKSVTITSFGSESDRPVPADYDGDEKDDVGVFGPSSGRWAIRGVSRANYGSSGDIPVTR